MKNEQAGAEGFKIQEFFVILVALAVFAVIMWLAFGKYYSAMMGVIRRYEMALFTPFFEGASALHAKLVALSGRPLSAKQTYAMLSKTGEYVRWLYVPPILYLGFYLYKRSYRRRFSTVHTMESLAVSQAVLWPEIAHVAGRQQELVSGDIRVGKEAVVATEWEFAERHRLAKRGGPLDREAARAVFVRQLGPLWTGPHDLPVHAKGLFAAFIMAIGDDFDGCLAAIRLMGKSFADKGPNGIDISFADEALKKHLDNPLVQRVMRQHAYRLTVLATALQVARARTGVVASGIFSWLRPVDRRLWYMLNTVGRRKPFIESTAGFSHWQFEKAVGTRISTPMLESAIDGLDKALKDFAEDDTEDRYFQ